MQAFWLILHLVIYENRSGSDLVWKPDKSFPIVISSQRLVTITSRSDINTECGPKEHEVKEV